MMPHSARPAGDSANYHAPLRRTVSSRETERELAMAWACLAAVRGPPFCERRVTVLRPFAF
jgi:hypothetical protein